MTQYDLDPDLFPNRVTVMRPPQSPTWDAGGAPNQAKTPVAGLVNVPASVQPADGDTMYRYAAREQRVSHAILLVGRVALMTGDVFVDEAGRTFEFKGSGDDAGLGALTQADCQLVAGAGLGST